MSLGWIVLHLSPTAVATQTLCERRRVLFVLPFPRRRPDSGAFVSTTSATRQRPSAWSPAQPLGAENPSTSCDLGILVDQAAESIEPSDLCAGGWNGRRDASQRGHLA
jgi:hypothetical protein